MNTQEDWRRIDEYENYFVSSMGRVMNTKTNKVLKPWSNGFHYQVRLYINSNSKDPYVHKLVAHAFLENPNNYKFVDHINRDSYDNNVQNLRWCSQLQNGKNRTKSANKSSKFKGVSWHEKAQKWQAGIRLSGKLIHLGYFISEEDAALVYNYFAKKLFEDFAAINQQLLQEYTEYVTKRIKELEVKYNL